MPAMPGKEMRARGSWKTRICIRRGALSSSCIGAGIAAALLFAAPQAALASGGEAAAGGSEAPTLSGYGGPGAGAEVIVGSHLYSEEQGQGRAGQGSAQVLPGLGVRTADGGSGTHAQGLRGGSGRSAEAQGGHGHSAGARLGGPRGGGPASGAGAAHSASGGAHPHGYAALGSLDARRGVAAVAALGLSGGDLLAAVLMLVALAALSILTRWLAAGRD